MDDMIFHKYHGKVKNTVTKEGGVFQGREVKGAPINKLNRVEE